MPSPAKRKLSSQVLAQVTPRVHAQVPAQVTAHPALHYLAPAVLVMGVFYGFHAIQDTLQHARDAFLLDVGVFRDTGRAIVEGFPLYSDEYYDFYSPRVQGWENTATWGWQNAVLDAWVTE